MSRVWQFCCSVAPPVRRQDAQSRVPTVVRDDKYGRASFSLPVGLRKTNICIPDVSSKNCFRLCYEYTFFPIKYSQIFRKSGRHQKDPKVLVFTLRGLVARGVHPCCRLRVGRPANWAAIPGSSKRMLGVPKRPYRPWGPPNVPSDG